MVYIASGVYVNIGDVVWGRMYTGNGNRPKLVHGEIISIESPSPYVDLETKQGIVHLPANVLHVSKPKATIIEDELGKLTIWEG